MDVIESAAYAASHRWSPGALGMTDEDRDAGCQTCYECDLPAGHERGDLPCDCYCRTAASAPSSATSQACLHIEIERTPGYGHCVVRCAGCHKPAIRTWNRHREPVVTWDERITPSAPYEGAPGGT